MVMPTLARPARGPLNLSVPSGSVDTGGPLGVRMVLSHRVHPAVCHFHDQVGLLGFLRAVGHVDDGVRQLADARAAPVARSAMSRCAVGSSSSDETGARGGEQGPGEGEALGLAAGGGRGAAGEPGVELVRSSRAARRGAARRRAGRRSPSGSPRRRFSRTVVDDELRLLRTPGDGGGNARGAAFGHEEAEQQREKRRLAGAGRPDDGDVGAGRDVERDVAEDGFGARPAHVDPAQLDLPSGVWRHHGGPDETASRSRPQVDPASLDLPDGIRRHTTRCGRPATCRRHAARPDQRIRHHRLGVGETDRDPAAGRPRDARPARRHPAPPTRCR